MGKAVGSYTSKFRTHTGALGSGRRQMHGTDHAIDKYDVKEGAFTQKLAGQGTQEAARLQQADLSSRLEARSKGTAPSIAEAQLRQATDRSLAQQLAGAQSRRGGSAASRERALSKAQASSTQQIASQASTAKLQERAQADQALSQQLASTRATDIGVAQADRASSQALESLKVKQGLGIQGLSLSANTAAQERRGKGLKRLFGISDENAKKGIKKEGPSKSKVAIAMSTEHSKKNVKSEATSQADVNQSIEETPTAPPQEKKKKGSSIASMVGTVASIMSMFSDEDSKENVDKEETKKKDKFKMSKVPTRRQERKGTKEDKKSNFSKSAKSSATNYVKSLVTSSSKKADTTYGSNVASQMAGEISDKNNKQNIDSDDYSPQSFLDALQAYSYEYKDDFKKQDAGGEGRFLSVMAQDLEKAGPVGKSMVEDTPEGKVVNYGKGFGAMLANQAHLNQRLNNLESKKNKK